jgi:hypothetical protein
MVYIGTVHRFAICSQLFCGSLDNQFMMQQIGCKCSWFCFKLIPGRILFGNMVLCCGWWYCQWWIFKKYSLLNLIYIFTLLDLQELPPVPKIDAVLEPHQTPQSVGTISSVSWIFPYDCTAAFYVRRFCEVLHNCGHLAMHSKVNYNVVYCSLIQEI